VVFPLVPKLWLGEGLTEAGASAQLCSQAGAWEQETKDPHPSRINYCKRWKGELNRLLFRSVFSPVQRVCFHWKTFSVAGELSGTYTTYRSNSASVSCV
jgi:hypothetical protein